MVATKQHATAAKLWAKVQRVVSQNDSIALRRLRNIHSKTGIHVVRGKGEGLGNCLPYLINETIRNKNGENRFDS